MSFMESVSPFEEGTKECHFNYSGCEYYKSGRCVYDIHPIKIQSARACHEDLYSNLIESEMDYDMGLL